MLQNKITLDRLKELLPSIVEAALWLCLVLFVIQVVRTIRRCPFWPRGASGGWCRRCFGFLCRYPTVEAKHYGTCRDLIQHENDLTNHRLTWLLTAEGLLFAALGFGLSKDNPKVGEHLIPVLSLVGITLAASASIVLDAADAAICRLSAAAPLENDKEADVLGYRGLPMLGLLAPWRIYPPMFIVAWYVISQMKTSP